MNAQHYNLNDNHSQMIIIKNNIILLKSAAILRFNFIDATPTGMSARLSHIQGTTARAPACAIADKSH